METFTQTLIELLNCKGSRLQLIRQFQESVWNPTHELEDEGLQNILLDLAYDLDFYEPNEDFRKEDPNYYGNERLEIEVKNALDKIEKLHSKNA
jgi:hypothetical protein